MNPLTKVIYAICHIVNYHQWYLIPSEYVSDKLIKTFKDNGTINIYVCRFCGLVNQNLVHVSVNIYLGKLKNHEAIIDEIETLKKREKEKQKYLTIWEKDKINNTFFDKSEIVNIDKMKGDKN